MCHDNSRARKVCQGHRRSGAGQSHLNSRIKVTSYFMMMRLFKAQLVVPALREWPWNHKGEKYSPVLSFGDADMPSYRQSFWQDTWSTAPIPPQGQGNSTDKKDFRSSLADHTGINVCDRRARPKLCRRYLLCGYNPTIFTLGR
jgi:hypothetical protein